MSFTISASEPKRVAGCDSEPVRLLSSSAESLATPWLRLIALAFFVLMSACGGGGSTSGTASPIVGGGSGSDFSGIPGPVGPTERSAGLLLPADWAVLGAFRVSADSFGASSMNYAQGVLAWHPQRRSLYMIGHVHDQAVAEWPVPADLGGGPVHGLPMVSAPLQGFVPLLNRVPNPQGLDRITGLGLIPDGPAWALMVQAMQYYDAGGGVTQTTAMLRQPDQLATSLVQGYYSAHGAARAAGWVSEVPSSWQSELGYSHLMGHSSGEPIISRFSVGPSAYLFNPAALASGTSVGAVGTQAVLSFSLEDPLHADLDNNSGGNLLWTHLSRAVFGFIVPGTRTYLTVGHSGGHGSGVCYKCVPQGATEACGGFCARHVDDASLYYWLWDVDDLLAVKRGEMTPSAPRPYAYGPLVLPFAGRQLGGGAYDPATRRLYLSLLGGDRSQGEYAYPPLLVVLQMPDALD